MRANQPYRARTLKAAQERVRQLQRHLEDLDALAGRYKRDREALLGACRMALADCAERGGKAEYVDKLREALAKAEGR